MDTISTVATSAANEEARTYFLRAEGKTLTIEMDRLRQFSVEELVAFANALRTVDTILLGVGHFAAFIQSAADPKFAALGVKENTSAGDFLEEIQTWISWLNEATFGVLDEKVPETKWEAKEKHFARISRLAFLADEPGEVLGVMADMISDIDNINRSENAARVKKEAAE